MGTVFASFATFGERCGSAVRALEELGHKVIISEQELNYDLMREDPALLPQIDGLIAGTSVWGAKEFDAMPNLKAIVRFGVGMELIDLEAAKARGIQAANTSGANARSVAEHTLGMTLGMLRSSAQLHQNLEAGRWTRACGHDLCGKTVGLIGFGHIAQHFAKMLSAFEDVTVIACRRRNTASPEAERLGVQMVPLDELLRRSDILSLHIPATPDTIGMFHEGRFAQMKRGAWLVNTARGALIDEAALLAALHSGQLSGAALDVFSLEPLPADSPLLGEPKLFLTPHTAADTYEGAERVGMMAAEEIAAALAGRPMRNWLNQ